jgi:Yip1-like protein
MQGQIEASPAHTVADLVTPWFTICFSPRATIRGIVDSDPRRFAVGIAWIAGALAALDLEIQFNSGQAPPNIPEFVTNWLGSMGSFGLAGLAFSLGVLGVAMLFLLGFLYRWSGGVLGGTATAVEVRAALAWTQAPAIYVTILGVVIAILSPEAAPREPGAPPDIPWWLVVRALLGFWVFVISLKTLGEVHRFSAWRALIAMILGNFALGIALVLGIIAVMIGRGLV